MTFLIFGLFPKAKQWHSGLQLDIFHKNHVRQRIHPISKYKHTYNLIQSYDLLSLRSTSVDS